MKKVTLEQLQKQHALLIPSLQDGFNRYPYRMETKTAEEYLQLFRSLTDKHGSEHSYVDFYFGRLSSEEKEGLLSQLPSTWKDYILSLDIGCDDLYFQLEGSGDIGLEILAYLSARELLFSTFYFTSPSCTIWCNYALNYPIFFLNEPDSFI